MDGGQDAVVRAETDGKLFQSEGIVQVHGRSVPRLLGWAAGPRQGPGTAGLKKGRSLSLRKRLLPPDVVEVMADQRLTRASRYWM